MHDLCQVDLNGDFCPLEAGSEVTATVRYRVPPYAPRCQASSRITAYNSLTGQPLGCYHAFDIPVVRPTLTSLRGGHQQMRKRSAANTRVKWEEEEEADEIE